MFQNFFAGFVIRHSCFGENVQQNFYAFVAASDRVGYRHTENFFKLAFVDFNSVPFCLVHHVQVDDERNTVFHELERQKKISRNVRRVDNVHDNIRFIFQKIIADDLFFLRTCVHRISSGQIDDGNGSSVVVDHADFFVNRHARPVADFLPRSGEFVKNCRFTGIGITGQCYR